MLYLSAKINQTWFRLELCPDPTGRAQSTPPDLLAGFRVLLPREKKRKREKKKNKEEKKEGEGK